MIKSKHHPLAGFLFISYIKWGLRRHFNQINVPEFPVDPSKSVLLFINHFSWWDGLFAYYLNKLVFRKKFHVMMLEEQLKRYWFFNHIGAFSVKKGSKSILESLNYSSEILTNPNNILVIFPQGKVESLYQNTIHFENGGIKLAQESSSEKTQIVFNCNYIDWRENQKPNFNAHLQASLSNSKVAEDYNKFYQDCLTYSNK